MIYLNNAATTFPKPECVGEAMQRVLAAAGSAGRDALGPGCHDGKALLECCRETVAGFLNAPDPSRLCFLPGCTYALNLAIQGLAWEAGDVALMSGLEHHAVSRPIRKVAIERGAEFAVAPYEPGEPVDLGWLESRLREGGVRLVACTMASNVTGEVVDVAAVCRLAREHGATTLIDAAQSVGMIEIDVGALGCDMLAFAGHKGLFGPPGVGGLWIRDGLELRTLAEGGTGSDSGRHEIGGACPCRYEVGTHNLPAIAGVAAGAAWVRERGVASIAQHERALVGRLIEGLGAIEGVTVHGGRDLERRTSAVSVTIRGMDPASAAAGLAQRGITTRAGFHCAPLAHETIGTLAGGGTLRLSPGAFTSEREIDLTIEAMREIVGEPAAAR